MKKTITLLLCIAVLFGVLAPLCYADEPVDSRKYVFRNAVSFTCNYDAESNKVIIDGTVSHDIMINYEDYFIHVVALLPGETDSAVLEYSEEDILAKTSMTVRFTFYIEAKNVLDRYSEYAIVFESPEGERFSAGTPMLPSVSSDFSYDLSSKDGFKGILTDSSMNINNSGAGTVVIDFDISKGIGDSSDGYLYPMGSTYAYIRRSYIDEIDKKMVAADLTDTKVYIRLLLPNGSGVLESVSDGMSAGYGTPNVYSEYVLDRVFAVAEFLTDRYNGENGNLFGFIAGTKIDEELSALTGKMTAEEYAELYTLYLVAVGSAARVLNNTLDIVIPISDAISENRSDTASYKLVENIVRRLDSNVSGDFDCSIMVESEHMPTAIEKENKTRLTADELDDFFTYIDSLSSKYASAPIHVIYKWKPNAALNGSDTCCAYIYSYMKLLRYGKISSFVLDISGDGEKYSSIRRVFECIDSGADEDHINGYAQYLGVTSWEELLGEKQELPVLRTVLTEKFTQIHPDRTIGEFCYMDFSSSNLTALMTQGENCSVMTSAYDEHGERLLQVSSKKMGMGEWFEVIGKFDYPENYYYTPVMSLEFEIEGGEASEYALYEICLTFGNSDTRIDVIGTAKAGRRTVLYFDASEFANGNTADFFKLSARCLTEDTSGISLMLHKVKGYSSVYDSQTLDRIISEYRASVREPEAQEEKKFNITAVIAIAVSIIAVGVGLIMVFRRDDEKEKND